LGKFSQVFKFKREFEYFIPRLNSRNILGIIPFAKIDYLDNRKPPEYFTHFLTLFQESTPLVHLLQKYSGVI
jgi:hypothetical protein